jgi:hypothetical protein
LKPVIPVTSIHSTKVELISANPGVAINANQLAQQFIRERNMGNPKLATALRCMGLALLVLGAFAFVPADVAAGGVPCTGPHGVSIFKSCVSPVNRCATSADCADTDLCNGDEQCATESDPGSNLVECTISLTNPAVHCDNITLLDAADAITNATGPGATSTTIEITGDCTGVVSGTCTDGTDLGAGTTCTIAPGGNCNFLANYYAAVPTDPDTLNDQATISVQDTCSGSPTGCSTTPNGVQFTASTDTVNGCTPGTPLDCDDGLFCTDDSCVAATGCAYVPHDCDDQDQCTQDTCNEATDVCDHTPDPTVPGCESNEEICRTPGFWGTHGGEEKSTSQNITQAVLDAFGGTLTICGATIDNTDVGNANSALEAICVSPKGDSRLQLARQLTAAALNCGITNATGTDVCDPQAGATPCAGVSVEDVFDACNAACPTGTTALVDPDNDPTTDNSVTVSCIGALDCFNNGGIFDVVTGDCAAAVESCHDRDLANGCFDFVPPGAAGSPRACNDARKNDVVVVPPLP